MPGTIFDPRKKDCSPSETLEEPETTARESSAATSRARLAAEDRLTPEIRASITTVIV